MTSYTGREVIVTGFLPLTNPVSILGQEFSDCGVKMVEVHGSPLWHAPMIITATFFSRQGAERAAGRAQALYNTYGVHVYLVDRMQVSTGSGSANQLSNNALPTPFLTNQNTNFAPQGTPNFVNQPQNPGALPDQGFTSENPDFGTSSMNSVATPRANQSYHYSTPSRSQQQVRQPDTFAACSNPAIGNIGPRGRVARLNSEVYTPSSPAFNAANQHSESRESSPEDEDVQPTGQGSQTTSIDPKLLHQVP